MPRAQVLKCMQLFIYALMHSKGNMKKLIPLLAIIISSCTVAQAQTPLKTKKRVDLVEMENEQLYIEAKRMVLLENYDKAVEGYKAFLDRAPLNAVGHYDLSKVYDIQKEDEKAIKSIEKAIELEPTNEWFHLFLADLHQKAGNDDKAANVYATLVKMKPENVEYYYKQAYFLVRSSQAPKAIKVYETLEKQTGLTEELARRKHTLYVGAGDYKKAAKVLESLIERQPNNTDYLHLLAGFYDSIESKKEAKNVYQRILAIDPDDAVATLGLSASKKAGSDDANYLLSLQSVFVKKDAGIDMKIKQLLPYIQKIANNGDVELAKTAITLSNILEEVHPEDPKAYSLAGDLHYYANEKEIAIEKYEYCLSLSKSTYLVWEQLCRVYAESNNYEKLAVVSEKGMDYFPNQAPLYYLNGIANTKLKNYSTAISSLNEASFMANRDPYLKLDILMQLGEAQYAKGDAKRALATWDKALAINPKNAKLKARIAEVKQESGM